MFDIAPTELLLVGLVALLVIGPKDLPRVMRIVGLWVGRARGVARQFRQGLDEMVREAELSEMEKQWAEENARIMREHPPQAARLPAAEQDAIDAAAADLGTGEPAAAAPSPVAADASTGAVPEGSVPRHPELAEERREASDEGDQAPVMVERPVVEPADPPRAPPADKAPS